MPCVTSKAKHNVINPGCASSCCNNKIRNVGYSKLCQCINENDSVVNETLQCLLDSGLYINSEIIEPSLGWDQLGQQLNGDQFLGASVTMNSQGDRIAFGIPGNAGNLGIVHVYQLNGTMWEQLGTNIIPGVLGDFGASISFNSQGNRLAVGVPSADSVFVYEYKTDGTNLGWFDIGSVTGNAASGFGTSVSLNAQGNILAVGAPTDNTEASSAGLVTVFEYDGDTTWNALPAIGEALNINDVYGTSVSLNNQGDILAVGSPGSVSDSGIVRVYQFDGSIWNLLGNPIPGPTSDRLGGYVSLNGSGNRVAIGTLEGDTGARVYEFNGADWILLGNVINSDFLFDRFGGPVALNDEGNILIASSNLASRTNVNSGQIKIYKYNGAMWAQLGDTINGLGNSVGERFGNSVAINDEGSIVVSGTNPITDNINGYVRAFEIQTSESCLDEQLTKILF